MEAVKLKDEVKQIFPNRVPLAESVRNIWAATVETGVTHEDIQNPKFWAHTTYKFNPGDRIEVRTDDSSFFAELYVISASKTHIKFIELQYHDLNGVKSLEIAQDYTAEWKGPHRKWTVMKGKEVIEEGFQTKDEADQKRLDILKAR